jgi:hypothetical protein
MFIKNSVRVTFLVTNLECGFISNGHKSPADTRGDVDDEAHRRADSEP